MVVNCQAGGSCNGGSPAQVYKFAHDVGLQHESCMQYTAWNLQGRQCTDIDICRDCHGPPPAEGDDGMDGCRAVTDTKYYISEYYNVRGADQMKAELYAHGRSIAGLGVARTVVSLFGPTCGGFTLARDGDRAGETARPSQLGPGRRLGGWEFVKTLKPHRNSDRARFAVPSAGAALRTRIPHRRRGSSFTGCWLSTINGCSWAEW